MVERRGHRHGHTDEYKQLSIKIRQSTYEKLKNRVDKTHRDLSNVSAVVETACLSYLDKDATCYKCGKKIKMDYNICPYCSAPILIDQRHNSSYFKSLYLEHHPEYQDNETYKYHITLNLEEMRKIYDGEFNFIPEKIDKISVDEINEHRAIAKQYHQSSEYKNHLNYARRILYIKNVKQQRQKNKE